MQTYLLEKNKKRDIAAERNSNKDIPAEGRQKNGIRSRKIEPGKLNVDVPAKEIIQ